MTKESISELVRFAPDVYGVRYVNHLSLFIVTSEGVILVDPCGEANPRFPAMIKEAVRVITPEPVRYVVYSHSALDHAAGGAVFAETARFVGQERVVERLVTAAYPETPPPDLTFEDEIELSLGGTRLHLYASKMTPVDDYLILHHPDARLLMYVDAYQPQSVPLRLHAGPETMIERIDWLTAKFDFDLMITGHATPRTYCTKEDLAEQREYLTDLAKAIVEAKAAGLGEREAMVAWTRAALAPRYGDWRRFEQCLAENVANTIDFAEGRFARH